MKVLVLYGVDSTNFSDNKTPGYPKFFVSLFYNL